MSKKPVTYDHLKSKKKPVYRSVWIALDSEVAEDEKEARQKVGNLKVRVKHRKEDPELLAELAQAEEDLKKLEKKLRDNSVKFTFKSLGSRKYEELVTDHQATEEQQAKAKEQEGPDAVLEFNPDTFPQELVAASLVSPKLSSSEVNELFADDNWNTSELMTLFQTALAANVGRAVIDLGNG